VPLTTLTVGTLPREKIGTGTAIFNVMRNIGGSVGVCIDRYVGCARGTVESGRALDPYVAIQSTISAAHRRALTTNHRLASGNSLIRLDMLTRNRSALRAMNSLNRFADPVYCIMRLIVGLMFACHGGQKLLGFPGGGHGGAQGLMLLGGIIELVGGLMIAFGFLTRLAAFISAGEMAVAYFMVHAAGKAIGHAPSPTEQFFPILNKGELAVVLCWLFLFMIFYGGGRWSIDSLIFKGRTAEPVRV